MYKEHLLLIPGFGANEKSWQHQIAYLAEVANIQVVIMDHQKTRQEMVDTLLNQAPPRFHLAGHSMGGWVAQAIAAQAPDRIHKLMLLNTWCSPDPKIEKLHVQVIEAIRQGQLDQVLDAHIPLLIHPARLQNKELVDGIKAMVKSFSPAILIQQAEAMLQDYTSLHLLPKITAPTLVLHSRQDALFSLSEHQTLCAHIKNATLAIVEDSGHASTVEQPQAVTALMRYFLESATFFCHEVDQ